MGREHLRIVPPIDAQPEAQPVELTPFPIYRLDETGQLIVDERVTEIFRQAIKDRYAAELDTEAVDALYAFPDKVIAAQIALNAATATYRVEYAEVARVLAPDDETIQQKAGSFIIRGLARPTVEYTTD